MKKIFFSIILNASILCFIAFLLWANPILWVASWVTLACGSCSYFSLEAWKIFLVGWLILGLINVTIRPILKLLALPFFLFFLSFTVFIINAVVLKLFSYIINDILVIPWISYTINGWVNFVIAVAIFTVLNMVYALLFSKK